MGTDLIDPYFLRAKRVEIPASITGLRFYLKMGYHFKNGNKELDDEHLYRLEKIRGQNIMNSFDELKETVHRLRAEDDCPWDREQTHGSLKTPVIEEAAEVICGINIFEQTGNPENLKEELGDLLLQVVMQAQIAEEDTETSLSFARTMTAYALFSAFGAILGHITHFPFIITEKRRYNK